MDQQTWGHTQTSLALSEKPGDKDPTSATLSPSIPVDGTRIFCSFAATGDAGLKPTPGAAIFPILALSASLPVSTAMFAGSLYPRASGRDMTPRVTVVSFMAPDGKTVDTVAPEPSPRPRSFTWM